MLCNVKYLIFTGKNLETGLRKKGLLSFIRELDGNDEDRCETYLKDASMYARGKHLYNKFLITKKSF